MHLFSESISSAYDESLEKSRRFFDKMVSSMKPFHERNITHGGEFLDDAIRMKDQPYRYFESDDTPCR